MRAGMAVLLCGAMGMAQAGDAFLPTARWTATSTTAIGVTGDVETGPGRMTIAGHRVELRRVAELRGADLENAAKTVDAGTGQGMTGALFATEVPGTTALRNGNTLCGGQAVRWMVFVRKEKELSVAMFSGATQPDLRPAAADRSTSLCGTYLYTR